jgi:hypothetical protein
MRVRCLIGRATGKLGKLGTTPSLPSNTGITGAKGVTSTLPASSPTRLDNSDAPYILMMEDDVVATPPWLRHPSPRGLACVRGPRHSCPGKQHVLERETIQTHCASTDELVRRRTGHQPLPRRGASSFDSNVSLTPTTRPYRLHRSKTTRLRGDFCRHKRLDTDCGCCSYQSYPLPTSTTRSPCISSNARSRRPPTEERAGIRQLLLSTGLPVLPRIGRIDAVDHE